MRTQFQINFPGMAVTCNTERELIKMLQYCGPIVDYTVELVFLDDPKPFIVPNPELHDPDCQCAVCVYGQDEWVRNFHASEY